jgi:hypothetical protein
LSRPEGVGSKRKFGRLVTEDKKGSAMSDRELLEKAAKAAGYTLGQHTQKDGALTLGGVEWNPLADDGDALRLSVKLDIWIHPGSGAECVEVVGFDAFRFGPGDDRQATIRRAIVRAAAAMAVDENGRPNGPS